MRRMHLQCFGGRGKGSGGRGGGGSGDGEVKKLMSVRTHEELADYMQAKVGVDMSSDSLRVVPLETLKGYASEVEKVLRDFPGLRGFFQSIGGNERNEDAYAGTRVSGRVDLNPLNQLTQEEVSRAYERDVSRGFHPKGTTWKSIMTHELGHVMEAYILQNVGGVVLGGSFRVLDGSGQRMGGRVLNNTQAILNSWRNSDVAGNIVAAAMNRVMPDWPSRPKEMVNMIRGISGYAAMDASETMAECISDYVANRSRAAPLSKEVYKITRSLVQ